MSRLSRLIGALVALGVVASIAIGGCLPTARDPVHGTDPVATKRTATRVLAQYSTRSQEIIAPSDQERIGTAMSGPIAVVTAGRLKIGAFHKADDEPPEGYGRGAFWLPAKTAGAPWFVASASRAGSTAQDLLLFTRTGAGKPYTAAYVVELDPGTTLPQVRHTAGGHVEAITGSDARLAVRPDALAGMHANIAQVGPATPAARSFEPSEWTTAVHTTMGHDIRHARKSGYVYHRAYHDSGYPAYSLRTADGGALVFYAVADELSVARDRPAIARPPLKLTRSLAGVVGLRRIRRQFQAVSLRQYVAYVPPRGRGKVRVLASAGGPVGGVGR